MKNKQTAVEWLEKEFDWVTNYMMNEHKEQVFKKAKEMEKEQIKTAYNQGVVNEISIYLTISEEEYYNKTYGN